MITRIIEVTNANRNWGKFMVCRPDIEWSRPALIETLSGGEPGRLPLLRTIGWGMEHIWVLDLQTGEGACFAPHGMPKADLDKHNILVCPMFEPFLEWLYQQDLTDLNKLPEVLDLPEAPFELAGYRRSGKAKKAAAPAS